MDIESIVLKDITIPPGCHAYVCMGVLDTHYEVKMLYRHVDGLRVGVGRNIDKNSTEEEWQVHIEELRTWLRAAIIDPRGVADAMFRYMELVMISSGCQGGKDCPHNA